MNEQTITLLNDIRTGLYHACQRGWEDLTYRIDTDREYSYEEQCRRGNPWLYELIERIDQELGEEDDPT